MKSVTLAAASLKAAFSAIDPLIDRRAHLPLACMRLHVAEGVAVVHAENAIGHACAAVGIVDADTGVMDICLPADRFAPVLAVADDEVSIALGKAGRATVKTGTYKFTLPTLPGFDQPDLRRDESIVAELDWPRLSDMVAEVLFACDGKDVRPFAQGVWIASDGEFVDVVATNARVLSTTRETLAGPTFGILIPRQSAAHLSRFGADRITVTASYLTAHSKNAALTLKPMNQKYIEWRKVFPEPKAGISFDAKQLRAAVGLHKFYGGAIGAVRILAEGTECTVTSKDSTQESEAEVDVTKLINTEGFDFAFDGGQLTNILGHAPDGEVTFFWNPDKVLGFLVQNGNWRGLITPMKL
jgi:DNA polymerase III beta subunit, central domain